MTSLPASDLRAVSDAVAGDLMAWNGRRILVTGATGFFGRWMLESALEMNRVAGAGLGIVAQSRDPQRFVQTCPHLKSAPGLIWLKADPLELNAAQLTTMTGSDHVDAVIHLVTEADGAHTMGHPVAALRTIVDSTRGALELARELGATRFLFTSSGSVYGKMPPAPDGAAINVRETDGGSFEPTDTTSAYAISGQAKRYAEQWCAAYAAEYQLHVTIARCFSFLGPGLPLAGKFAAGNFLADALAGRDIEIRSDGRPERSYLYASDLAVWLWKLLLHGRSGRAYNVGSEKAVSLRALAELVREEVNPAVKIQVLGESSGAGVAERFVPDTTRVAQELGLRETVDLREAIRRTAQWHRQAST
jgi:nucleoside-diphosphate-sugar epimerase